MSNIDGEKVRYIEYPDIEVITGGEEEVRQESEPKKEKKEPETITLSRFHFLLILICALFVLAYRLFKFALCGFFALLTAFRNEQDNANFSNAYDDAKEMFWHCLKLSLGVLVPSWGARFLH